MRPEEWLVIPEENQRFYDIRFLSKESAEQFAEKLMKEENINQIYICKILRHWKRDNDTICRR